MVHFRISNDVYWHTHEMTGRIDLDEFPANPDNCPTIYKNLYQVEIKLKDHMIVWLNDHPEINYYWDQYYRGLDHPTVDIFYFLNVEDATLFKLSCI